MIELLWAVLIVLVGLFLIPLTVYVSARMGSYGWLKGKYLFWLDHKRSNTKRRTNCGKEST